MNIKSIPSNLTVVDAYRVGIACIRIFGKDGPGLGDLKKLAVAVDAVPDLDPPGFVNPGFAIDPSVIQTAQAHALRLRAALIEAHGQQYVDDLWARIRK